MDSRPGETVLFEGHPSWLSMTGFLMRWLVASLVLGIAAGIASIISAGHEQTSWVIVAVLAVWLLTFGRGQLRRSRVTYRVTDRRLVIETGLIVRRRREAHLDFVHNVTVRQTLLQRAFGVGTVHFETTGEAGGDFRFRAVEDPRSIVRAVDRAQDRRLPDRDLGILDLQP